MSDNRQNTKTVFLRKFQCATNGARVQNKTALRPRKGVRQGQASPWKVFTTLVLSLQHSVNVVSVGVAKSILTMLQCIRFSITLCLTCHVSNSATFADICYILQLCVSSFSDIAQNSDRAKQHKNDKISTILIFNLG